MRAKARIAEDGTKSMDPIWRHRGDQAFLLRRTGRIRSAKYPLGHAGGGHVLGPIGNIAESFRRYAPGIARPTTNMTGLRAPAISFTNCRSAAYNFSDDPGEK